MLSALMNLWDFLNGKKTMIGAAILTIAVIITKVNSEVLVGIWELSTPVWLPKLVSTLDWIGGSLTAVGFLHKAVKP